MIIYVRDKFSSDNTFVLNHNDTHIWLRLDCKYFNFDNDLFVCICYIVPDNSSRNAFVDFNVYDTLLDNIIYIKNLTDDKCNFVCLGDFNARVGNRNDFVSDDNSKYINILPDDYVIDTELHRNTQDNGVNSNGLILIDFLKQSGLRIANGRVCGDPGACTFVGNRGCSLVDYCIVNPDIFNFFTSFDVHEPNILSDHCLVEFSLKSKTFINNDANLNFCDEEIVEDMYYFKWDNDKKEDYKLNLQSQQFTDSLLQLTSNMCDINTPSEIDTSLSSFITNIEDICNPLFKKIVLDIMLTQREIILLQTKNVKTSASLFIIS